MARTTRQRGFTLIELMIVVAIIGLLAAVAIPLFMGHMKRAKQNEAVLELNKLGKNAKTYYVAHVKFPTGTAGVLPGADGASCATTKKKFTASTAWANDPIWAELEFEVIDDGLYSYHFTSATGAEAEALAVADLDCDRTLSTYKLKLTVPDGTPAAEIIEPVDLD